MLRRVRAGGDKARLSRESQAVRSPATVCNELHCVAAAALGQVTACPCRCRLVAKRFAGVAERRWFSRERNAGTRRCRKVLFDNELWRAPRTAIERRAPIAQR